MSHYFFQAARSVQGVELQDGALLVSLPILARAKQFQVLGGKVWDGRRQAQLLAQPRHLLLVWYFDLVNYKKRDWPLWVLPPLTI